MTNFNDIRIFITDVDGVLTDGIYQISEQEVGKGIVTKSFYTKDFYAIEQMIRAGIFVFIITQSHDRVIERQIERISSHSKFWMDQWCGNKGLKVLTGIENKKNIIHSHILMRNEWGWNNVAYMGDAENDIECMKKALWTGCPSDAIEDVKENSNYISDFPGGKGAVYDFCVDILNKRNKEKE